MRKAVRRVTTTLAAMALVLGVVMATVPSRAVPREYDVPPGVVEVSCGSLFSSTKWSLDEVCDSAIVGRIIGMTLSFFVALVFGLVALPLLVLRYRIWRYGSRTMLG